MALTSIGSQKTPGRPVEVTFGAETGLPANVATLMLIGHAATGATGVNTVVTISNVADPVAGKTEAETKFGVGSELAKMVVAAIKANAGGSTFPPIKCAVLANADVTIAAAAQAAILKSVADFIVTPYDLSADTTDRAIVLSLAQTLSGAQRVQNQQFGSVGIGAARNSDPTTLFKFDTQFLLGAWQRDTTGVNPYSLGELAAAAAAVIAANTVPFNPLDDVDIGSVPASTNVADYPTVGAGLESEAALAQGWTPIWTKPNGSVSFVRTVTGRLSADGSGSPLVGAYYDVQDFQVLYFWRKTLFTRFSQPDFKRTKASAGAAQALLGETVRLARQFEDQNMFQAVSQLAKQFRIERNASDRHRFDILTPVNVIPGLHVIATNVVAGTQFDTVTL